GQRLLSPSSRLRSLSPFVHERPEALHSPYRQMEGGLEQFQGLRIVLVERGIDDAPDAEPHLVTHEAQARATAGRDARQAASASPMGVAGSPPNHSSIAIRRQLAVALSRPRIAVSPKVIRCMITNGAGIVV